MDAEVMEDDLSITCPCCSAEIYFDQTGEPYADQPELAELAPNEFRGLAGLVSVDATAQWRKQDYQFNQQGLVLDAPTSTAHAEEEEQINEIELPTSDPELEKAIQTDLSKRNIKTKTKTTN